MYAGGSVPSRQKGTNEGFARSSSYTWRKSPKKANGGGAWKKGEKNNKAGAKKGGVCRLGIPHPTEASREGGKKRGRSYCRSGCRIEQEKLIQVCGPRIHGGPARIQKKKVKRNGAEKGLPKETGGRRTSCKSYWGKLWRQAASH